MSDHAAPPVARYVIPAEQERDELNRMLAEALRCGWHSLEGSEDGTFDDLTHAEIAAMRSHAFALVTGRPEDGAHYVYGTSEAIRELQARLAEQRALVEAAVAYLRAVDAHDEATKLPASSEERHRLMFARVDAGQSLMAEIRAYAARQQATEGSREPR